jgi:hypothetical protein
MRHPCDVVAERVALGEPLGDAAEHAAGCAHCRVTVALPAQLGGTHAAVDPGLGFAARMTAGAQHRIVVRKRRRVVGGAAAAVAAFAAAALVVAQVASGPAEVAVKPAPTKVEPSQPKPALQTKDDKEAKNDIWDHPAPQPTVDPDVRALVHLADIDRDLRGTAHWDRIEKPLRPYRSLVHGVKP